MIIPCGNQIRSNDLNLNMIEKRLYVVVNKHKHFMVTISKKLSLIIFFCAGFTFIGIGVAGIIDSNIPRFVEITEMIKPNQSVAFTPDMNSGNTANIYTDGSSQYTILVTDPNKNRVLNKTQSNEIFNETIVAEMNGEFKIQIINGGNDTLNLNLGSYSKSSSLAFSGQMMLIITGIVVLGLGFRARMQS